MRTMIAVLVFWGLCLPASGAVSELAPLRSLLPQLRPQQVHVTARWDHLPQGAAWTHASLVALRTHARGLAETVPADIPAWCPRYPSATMPQRRAFWVGLISALAKHESTWRPTAVGGGNRWFGLTQIWPPTARHFGCNATTGLALRDGPANLSCALRIMARTVPRDGVVSRGMRGVAADWGPFHSRRKLDDMRKWVRTQPYCIGLGRSPVPRLRPHQLTVAHVGDRDAPRHITARPDG